MTFRISRSNKDRTATQARAMSRQTNARTWSKLRKSNVKRRIRRMSEEEWKVAGKIGTFRATLCISMAILNNTSTKRSIAASETHRTAKEPAILYLKGHPQQHINKAIDSSTIDTFHRKRPNITHTQPPSPNPHTPSPPPRPPSQPPPNPPTSSSQPAKTSPPALPSQLPQPP